MSQTNINIRIEENLKESFDPICQELGLTMTTAFTVFAKTVVRQNRIPFEISLEIPNDETKDAIKEVQNMKKNPLSEDTLFLYLTRTGTHSDLF